MATKTLTRSMTYAELVAAIGAGTLNKGESITITDFATKHYMCDGDGDVILDENLDSVTNTGSIEPLTLLATSSNTIDCIAKSTLYPQDIIHYDWNPENWKFDLAFGAHDEEVLSGFKGVIYFRHDTINDVSMGHDWRKVLNRRWKWNYPDYNPATTYGRSTPRFSWPSYSIGTNTVQDSTGIYISMKAGNTGNALTNIEWWEKIIDYSITPYSCMLERWAKDVTDFIDVPLFYSQEINSEDQYNREVETVHFKPMKEDTVNWYWIATILQNNVFALAPDKRWHQVMGITAEILCVNNTFADYQESNVLGANFSSNSIGKDFHSNSIGVNFQSNSIGASFNSNSIGASFNSNSIGANFHSNSIGVNFNSNSIGANFQSNSIGANFNSNSIGANFQRNSIGANFHSNSIGDYTQKNTFGAFIQHLIIPSKTVNNGFRHNNIKDGISGTSGAKLDFTAATHVFADYNCEISKTSTGTIKLKYLDGTDNTEKIVDYNA
jgi:hypothetical protein